MKIEPQHKRLPRKFSRGVRSGPRLSHLSDLLTYLEIRFTNQLGCFERFQNFFFMETLG